MTGRRRLLPFFGVLGMAKVCRVKSHLTGNCREPQPIDSQQVSRHEVVPHCSAECQTGMCGAMRRGGKVKIHFLCRRMKKSEKWGIEIDQVPKYRGFCV